MVARTLSTPRDADEVESYYNQVLRHELVDDPLAAKAAHGSSGNKHGRRINPRKGIPMHVMATYALLRLSGHEGNLSDMSAKIEENLFFSRQLDWTPRPGTKTYPRCAHPPRCALLDTSLNVVLVLVIRPLRWEASTLPCKAQLALTPPCPCGASAGLCCCPRTHGCCCCCF